MLNNVYVFRQIIEICLAQSIFKERNAKFYFKQKRSCIHVQNNVHKDIGNELMTTSHPGFLHHLGGWGGVGGCECEQNGDCRSAEEDHP